MGKAIGVKSGNIWRRRIEVLRPVMRGPGPARRPELCFVICLTRLLRVVVVEWDDGYGVVVVVVKAAFIERENIRPFVSV